MLLIYHLLSDSFAFRYGNPLGPVQGVGYASELLLRLVSSSQSPYNLSIPPTNQDSSLPFPLRKYIYLDFTHDNLMVAVFGALGLFVEKEPLPTRKMVKERKWVISSMTPFMGRMVVERLDCVIDIDVEHGEGRGALGEYVRIMVNEAVQKLPFCRSEGLAGSTADKFYRQKHLCPLKDFVEGLPYVTSGGDGDWEKCFGTDCDAF